MKIDMKQFSPYRISLGMIFIPILAISLDLMIRVIVMHVVALSQSIQFISKQNVGVEELTKHLLLVIKENFHLISFIYSILQIIVFLVFFRLCRKRSTPYLFTRAPQGFVWPLLPIFVLAGIGLTTLWMNLVQFLSHSSGYWQGVVKAYEVVNDTLAMKDHFVLQFLNITILVPIAEELLFRGILLSEWKQAMKAEWAVLLSAIAFGVFHMNLLQGLYAFLLGLLIGLVYVWTESIWTAILMHMLFNFYGGTLNGILHSTQKEIPVYHWYHVLPMIMIFVAIPALIYLYQHRREAFTVARHSKYDEVLQALALKEAEQQTQAQSLR